VCSRYVSASRQVRFNYPHAGGTGPRFQVIHVFGIHTTRLVTILRAIGIALGEAAGARPAARLRPPIHGWGTYRFNVEKIRGRQGLRPLRQPSRRGSRTKFLRFFGEAYRELGVNYFDERRRQFTIDRLTRRITHLGYGVHLEPVAVPAV
jgi:hypothetical protein